MGQDLARQTGQQQASYPQEQKREEYNQKGKKEDTKRPKRLRDNKAHKPHAGAHLCDEHELNHIPGVDVGDVRAEVCHLHSSDTRSIEHSLHKLEGHVSVWNSRLPLTDSRSPATIALRCLEVEQMDSAA